MTPALGILLTLLTLEGLLLVLCPGHVRAIIRETPDGVLRVVGIIELAIVLVVILLVLKVFGGS
jgi:uncharacterized protein YjeT (DUF2065 family)